MVQLCRPTVFLFGLRCSSVEAGLVLSRLEWDLRIDSAEYVGKNYIQTKECSSGCWDKQRKGRGNTPGGVDETPNNQHSKMKLKIGSNLYFRSVAVGSWTWLGTREVNYIARGRQLSTCIYSRVVKIQTWDTQIEITSDDKYQEWFRRKITTNNSPQDNQSTHQHYFRSNQQSWSSLGDFICQRSKIFWEQECDLWPATNI